MFRAKPPSVAAPRRGTTTARRTYVGALDEREREREPLQLAATQLLNLPILDDAEVDRLRHSPVEDAALVAPPAARARGRGRRAPSQVDVLHLRDRLRPVVEQLRPPGPWSSEPLKYAFFSDQSAGSSTRPRLGSTWPANQFASAPSTCRCRLCRRGRALGSAWRDWQLVQLEGVVAVAGRRGAGASECGKFTTRTASFGQRFARFKHAGQRPPAPSPRAREAPRSKQPRPACMRK